MGKIKKNSTRKTTHGNRHDCPAPAKTFLLPLLHMPAACPQGLTGTKGRGAQILLLSQQQAWLLFLRASEGYVLFLASSILRNGSQWFVS